MKILKITGLFIICCSMVFTACNKDNLAPFIESFTANGVAADSGFHPLGSTVNFQIAVQDDSELGRLEIYNESLSSEIIDRIDLNGTTFQDVSYDLTVSSDLYDSSLYSAGDTAMVELSFLVADDRGSFDGQAYTLMIEL